MAKRLIAILEDDPRRTAAMREVLGRVASEFDHLFFDNAPDMLEWLEQQLTHVAIVSLDHDLGATRLRDGVSFDPGTGRDVVDFLAARPCGCAVIIHSNNYPAVLGMCGALRDGGWRFSCVTPYGDLEWIERAWAAELGKVVEALGR